MANSSSMAIKKDITWSCSSSSRPLSRSLEDEESSLSSDISTAQNSQRRLKNPINPIGPRIEIMKQSENASNVIPWDPWIGSPLGKASKHLSSLCGSSINTACALDEISTVTGDSKCESITTIGTRSHNSPPREVSTHEQSATVSTPVLTPDQNITNAYCLNSGPSSNGVKNWPRARNEGRSSSFTENELSSLDRRAPSFSPHPVGLSESPPFRTPHGIYPFSSSTQHYVPFSHCRPPIMSLSGTPYSHPPYYGAYPYPMGYQSSYYDLSYHGNFAGSTQRQLFYSNSQMKHRTHFDSGGSSRCMSGNVGRAPRPYADR